MPAMSSTPATDWTDRPSTDCDPPVKVVVTGGAGFIGGNLCAALAAERDIDEVVALDDLSTGRATNLDGLDVELVVGSILDADLLDRVTAGASAIVHLAARPSVPRSLVDPMASHDANATGTLQVLEASRRHDRPQVVVASSSSVYGANPELPKREDMVAMPVSPYAVSKLAAESYALAYQHSFGVPVLAFRFFNVFGPLQPADHDYAAVVPTFLAAALGGEALTVHGDGRQTRDFTYVATVASVIVDAVRRSVTSPRPVNLAFGTRVSLLELIELIEAQLGTTVERVHSDPRPGDVRDSQADQSALRRLFPTVKPVTLEEGLHATLDWFRRPS
jgi:UDP-glucose 4-epimerase